MRRIEIINVGDTVFLRDVKNPPPMLVIEDRGLNAYCEWFVNNNQVRKEYEKASLTKVHPKFGDYKP